MASSVNSKETRKKKLEKEMQKFNEKWTFEYFFIENADSRSLCLICNQTVNVSKEYNNKRHYDSKHTDGVYGKLEGRDVKNKQLKEQLKSQRFMFQKLKLIFKNTDNEKTVRCSYLIAQRIAQTMKPYSEGDFVKKCLTDVAEEMCPKMVQEFEKPSLSRWTITGASINLLVIFVTLLMINSFAPAIID